MPPIAVSHQLLAAFGGDDEGQALILLRDGVSHADSKNVYLDKIGRLARILGYSAQGAAYTTDTGGSATKVVGLFPYTFGSAGSQTRRTLGVFDDETNEYEVAYSDDEGATWTFLEDLGSGPIGNLPDSAAFGDERFLTFGSGTPRKFSDTTLSTVGVTQSPTPTAAENGDGNLSGSYEYKIVSMKADKVRLGGSAASTEITLQAKQVSLSWTADADGDVIGYEIYRTTGTGELFYRIGYVAGRTTVAFTENVTDSQALQGRILEASGDPPPDGMYYCESHGNRMWWLRTDADPRKAYYSDRSRAEEVGAASFLDFTAQDGGGDRITGATGNFFRSLIIWLEQSVWRVSGTGTLVNNVPDLRREQTSARVGAVSHRSVAPVPTGSIFTGEGGGRVTTSGPGLAYFTPNLDIRVLDGDADVIVSKAKEDFLATVNWAARETIHAIEHPDLPAIVWFVPTGASTVPNAAVMWDYSQGAWFEIDTAPFLCSMVTDDDDVLVGSNSTSTGGLTYQWWSGNSFNGSNIEAVFWTKPLYGHIEGAPASHLRKRARRLDLVFEAKDATFNVTVDWYNGYAEEGDTPYGTSTVDLDDANASHKRVRVRLNDTGGNYPVGRQVRFRVSTTGTGAQWSLDHGIYHFQILPGLAE